MSQPNWIGYTLGGRYKIDSLLGQGGMSAVYRGTDPNLRRTVAIKLIHSHLTGDPEFVRRFEAEAAAVAQLRHPHIIQVYDFNNDGATYYMILEFVPGETLHARLRRLSQAQQRMAFPEALDILANISDAVAYAHNRGLIHRDIKPANIMINPQGEAVLMDFGVAKILGGAQHTATGAVVGTALYISPEQVMGKQPSERSDIYALGVTLYEMIAGRPPFDADSAMSIMMKHVNDPVPDVRQLNPQTPPDLVAVVERSLAKDPAQRYQSATELAAALRQVGARLGGAPGATMVEALPHQAPATMMESAPPAGMAAAARTGMERQPTARQATGQAAPAVPGPAASAPPKRKFPMWLAIVLPLAALVCLGLTVGGGMFIMAKLGATPVVPTAETAVAVATSATAAGAATEQGEATTPPEAATLPPAGEPSATPTPEPSPTLAPTPEFMAYVPGGSYLRGFDDGPENERPAHHVTVFSYYIDLYEVTNGRYQACVDDGACSPPEMTSSFNRFSYFGNPDYVEFPVIAVTWDQAQTYCQWDGGKRLPTEAEWEYAATGGDGRRYPWGSEFDGALVPSRENDTVAVGSFPGGVSPFGVYDMAGNVLEWVSDYYDAQGYAEAEETNPQGPQFGTLRVLRGGSFGAADGQFYTTTRRYSLNPTNRDVDIGFRCVLPEP